MDIKINPNSLLPQHKNTTEKSDKSDGNFTAEAKDNIKRIEKVKSDTLIFNDGSKITLDSKSLERLSEEHPKNQLLIAKKAYQWSKNLLKDFKDFKENASAFEEHEIDE